MSAADRVRLVLGVLCAALFLAWCLLPLLSELAPGLLAPLQPWIHSFLFG